MFTPAFRLALNQHLRPTAVLFRDPHFGHRNSFTMRPDGDPGDWTSWDYALGTAMQIIEDSTTEEGHLAWEVEGDDVYVEAIRRTNKARAAIDRITNQENYKSKPGEYFVTEMHQMGIEHGQEKFQTRRQWIEKMTQENAPDEGSVD